MESRKLGLETLEAEESALVGDDDDFYADALGDA
jgi:hypothetical protein